MQPEDHRTQYVAIFLIVLAAVCIAIGSKFEWRDLVNFATMFGGGGVGILTGQKLQQVTNQDGGQITVNPASNSPEVKP